MSVDRLLSTDCPQQRDDLVVGPVVLCEPYPVRGGTGGTTDRLSCGPEQALLRVDRGSARTPALWLRGPAPLMAALDCLRKLLREERGIDDQAEGDHQALQRALKGEQPLAATLCYLASRPSLIGRLAHEADKGVRS